MHIHHFVIISNSLIKVRVVLFVKLIQLNLLENLMSFDKK